MTLLSLKDITIKFGEKPLFSGVSLNLEKGERLCLIGANGSGKTTLLKIMTGIVSPDSGEKALSAGAKIQFLPQAPDFGEHKSIFSYVASGLSETERLESPHLVEDILSRFGLDGSLELQTLSGGEKKRTDLAKVLISSPDILFLDEPTNHLDLPTIDILEKDLKNFSGAIIVVSHDRAFLSNLTNRIGWLHNQTLWWHNQGFATFEEWSESIMNAEERELERMQTKLKQELHWLQRGVTARRKRNQGRLKKLHILRKETAERKRKTGDMKLNLENSDRSGVMVVEAQNINKSFDCKNVISDFSIRITRGERIGIIGANGAGKTTLLKMLTGQMLPDSGSIRLGENLKTAFFDQHRTELNLEKTLKDTICPAGGDFVILPSGSRHIASYLKDFLFAPEKLLSPVKVLSGGEKNRLLLALKLSEPCNLMIMDEPTNDLDIETLDLLQEMLDEFPGTLLIVSHDRDFLDKTVTSILAFEENGKVTEYVGGYSDYLEQKQKKEQSIATNKPAKKAVQPQKTIKIKTKLSYNEQRLLQELPNKIAKLNSEINLLENKLADASFYEKNPAQFNECVKTLELQKSDLEKAEESWLELELLREELEDK
ncbi:MAG: ABC-F family ATP-binding cassette domain-containing protein [Alphaproteobacteria bacterium]